MLYSVHTVKSFTFKRVSCILLRNYYVKKIYFKPVYDCCKEVCTSTIYFFTFLVIYEQARYDIIFCLNIEKFSIKFLKGNKRVN